jgi:anti-anti-sigma factor
MSRRWHRAGTQEAVLDGIVDVQPLGTDGKVIVAAGELDVATAPALRERLHLAVESGVSRLVLDLSAVTFIDSLSLAAVVGAKRRMGPGSQVAIVTEHPYVLLILQAGGLDGVLRVYATRDEAEGAIGSGG